MSNKKQLCMWIDADLMDFFNKQADKHFHKTKELQLSIKSTKYRSMFIVDQLERIKADFEREEDE